MTVRTPRLTAVVLGLCGATAPTLRARLNTARRVEELDGVLDGIVGRFHLVAHDGDTIRVQGPAFESDRVFHTTVSGTVLVSSSEHIAAWLAESEPDDRALAMRLSSVAPYALADRTPWQGVQAVPGGSALYVNAVEGRSRVARWWRPPEAELSLKEGAVLLRDVLRDAVKLRVRATGGVVAADLSGGLDSTSLCFLANEAGAELTTATLDWAAAGNEDRRWAERAAAGLPGMHWRVFGKGELPAHFSGLDRRRAPQEEPSALVRDSSQQRVISRYLARSGASLRLSGHGGDQAVLPPAAHLADLLRSHPVRGLQQLSGFRAQGRWGLRETWRMVTDRRDYRGWLEDVAGRGPSAVRRESPPPNWEDEPNLPPWVTPKGWSMLRDVLLSGVDDAEPLAATRGAHARVHAARQAGRLSWQLTQDSARAGLPISAPFCDDAVVEACLSVRSDELRRVEDYKPLLTAAMQGIVPAELLQRKTKDHCAVEWYDGLSEHRRQLSALTVDSPLVARGLVDRAVYGRMLGNPGLLTLPAQVVESTLAVETWLRDVDCCSEPAFGLNERKVGREAGA